MCKMLKYLRIVALFLFLFMIFFSFPSFCNAHDHYHEHEHNHGHPEEPPEFKYTAEANVKSSQSGSPRPKKQTSISSLWLQALSSTLIISIAPFLLLYFVPIDHRRGHEFLLKILLSFASGGLLGDAFLHLIPHALQPHEHGGAGVPHVHEHSHGHAHDNTGAWVLAGILAFLILDKIMRWVNHPHSHAVVDPAPAESNEKNEKTDVDNSDAMSESDENIKETAFLNLIADFVHNLTDGFAIGASYLAGETVGLVTTITVLFHEVPHEIGDFAILIQSGYSKKKAMLLQLVTALGAFAGTAIALWFRGVDATMTSWALPFTAGGFIYIATVSIIPDLLTDTSFWQSVKEILALILGVLMMVIVAKFE